jgi:hypothetical protein
LVAQITAVVAKSQENGANANVARDAVQYVNALIYEASPFNEGPKGLRDAHKQISVDAKAMLAFIRDASLRQGKRARLTKQGKQPAKQAVDHPTANHEKQDSKFKFNQFGFSHSPMMPSGDRVGKSIFTQ